MSAGRLEQRRVLVVGASDGVGRASALAIAAAGGRVAFAARRLDRLEQLAAEAGPGCLAVRCDATDAESCAAAVDSASEALGGLDGVVYTPGITLYGPIETVDAERWRLTFDTNVVGATLVTAAAIPHLIASRGKAIFISSIVIDDSPPRYGLAPYVVSKAALERLSAAWQGEHPAVGFTTISMGDTETGKMVEPERELNELMGLTERWTEEGYMYGRRMQAESIAEQVVNVLASPETIRRLTITPHYADEATTGS